jgi:long-chain acyl-CoA synthetase
MVIPANQGGIRLNLVQLLEKSVRLHGDKECLRYKRGGQYVSMSYGEFWRSVLNFAAGMRQLGVQPGDKIGILSTNCPEWAIADYAALAVGAVVVPVYPTLPEDQVLYILNNADVFMCVVEDFEQYQKIASRCPEQLKHIAVIRSESMSENHLSPPWFPFTDLLELGQEADVLLRVPAEVPVDGLATIVHTSGTSGNPKGVMLTHRNIVSNVLASLEVAPVYATDVSLSYLPLSHIFERTVGQFAALTSGACIAYAESLETIQQNLLEVRPTVLVTVPRLLEKVYGRVMENVTGAPGPLRRLLHLGLQGRGVGLAYRLVDRLVYRKIRQGLGGRIRVVVSGGAALSREVAQFFLNAGIPVLEGYGMTESSPVICVNPPSDIRPGTVGRPIRGVSISLADDGELLVRGPNVMRGYYKDEEASQEALQDGWLHTGDVAELVDGYVRIVDRKKHILVLATGKNVAPAPIESAITMSSYVSAAILLGDGRQYVTCLISPNLVELRPIAERLNLSEDPREWVQHPEIRALFAREVQARIASFAPFERPKRAALIAEELSIESGGLTPTLKVRSKIVMERYGAVVEAMYNGTDYIPLVEGDQGTDTHLPESTSATHIPVAASSRSRRRKLYALGAAAAVLLCGALAFGMPHLPKNLDVLGMVKGIQHTNDQIGTENQKIVGDLKHVNQLASNTPSMAQQLKGLNRGVGTDKSMLTTLSGLSQQEIDLSQQFYSLAKRLKSDMSSIDQSAREQNSSLQAMTRSAASVSKTLSRIAEVNQSTSKQLGTADGKARRIADEMP